MREQFENIRINGHLLVLVQDTSKPDIRTLQMLLGCSVCGGHFFLHPHYLKVMKLGDVLQ